MNMALQASMPNRRSFSLTGRFLLLSAILAIACNPASRGFAADPPFAEGAAQRLSDATQGASSGLAVLVAREGEILFQGGYGLADIEKKTPITPETKFRIGSISKQFTAAGCNWRSRKLSLDDSLPSTFQNFRVATR
jgi:CubicO group peptidase (beta-lactamase class C family)